MGMLKSVTVTDLPASSARALRLPRWARMPVNTGTRGQLAGGRQGTGKGSFTGSPNVEPPVNDAPTLKEMGVDKKRAARAKPEVSSGDLNASGPETAPTSTATCPGLRPPLKLNLS
jgi:hypothetical protein